LAAHRSVHSSTSVADTSGNSDVIGFVGFSFLDKRKATSPKQLDTSAHSYVLSWQDHGTVTEGHVDCREGTDSSGGPDVRSSCIRDTSGNPDISVLADASIYSG